jgi:hypothetical protein
VSETLTYHDKVSEKKATLKQLRLHRQLDQIVQGTYWEGNGEGKGCAVGCLTHDPHGGHSQFPDRWGIPVQLAYLIDHIFESLAVEESKDWPVRFMSAIPVGKDLSRVWDRFCVWMLKDLVPIAGENIVVLEQMILLFERAIAGDEPNDTEWTWAAWAAWAAGDAGRNRWASRAADELVRLVKSA